MGKKNKRTRRNKVKGRAQGEDLDLGDFLLEDAHDDLHWDDLELVDDAGLDSNTLGLDPEPHNVSSPHPGRVPVGLRLG